MEQLALDLSDKPTEESKKTEDFVHLHVHSQYSLLDGVPSPDQIIEKVVSLGQPAVAITDHGYMFASYKHQQACLDAGIKAIHGFEAYFVDDVDTAERQNYHLILLAKNEEGWRNLIALNTLAGQHFYYRPRLDRKMLFEHRAGLIVLSACYMSPVTFHFSVEGRDVDKAVANFRFLRETFGEDFYNEAMHIGWENYDTIVPEIVDLAMSEGVKTVATNDAHYCNKEDAIIQTTMLKIATGGKNGGGLEFGCDSLYIKSLEEMLAGDITKAMTDTTLEVADKVRFELSFDGYKFPSFSIKESADYEDFLRDMQKRKEHGLG